MSDILNKVNQIGLNTDFPIAGQNNSTEGFRQNSRAVLAGLTQAGDELTKIQKTRFTFTGDGTGSTNAIGAAIVAGTSDPLLEVRLTLSNVLSNAGAFDTHAGNYSFTFDAKGRLVTVTPVSHTIDWNAGHAANTVLDVTGTGKDSLTFPTYQFDGQGRVTASRTKTITFGLEGQRLTTNALLVGKSNLSAELLPPVSPKSHILVFDGTAVGWQEVQESSGSQVATVLGGQGIRTESNEAAVTVHLDLTKLATTTDLQDEDLFAIQDASTAKGGLVSLANLRSKLVKVKLDEDPELGGPLNVGSQFIWSSTSTGVVLQSSRLSPKATLSIRQDGIRLTGDTSAPISIDAPNLLLNGIKFPVTAGTRGQVLSSGIQGLEWSTSDNYDNPLTRVLFVAPSGDDADSGSMNRPLASIAQAISRVPTNSNDLWSIILLGGTYNEDVYLQNKRKIALESLFHSGPAIITGTLALDFGVDEFYMNNVTWDSRATTRDPVIPTWSIQYGLARGTVRNCAFLRKETTEVALGFNGQTTGPLIILDCEIRGTIRNEMELSEDGEVIIESLHEKLDKNLPVVSTDEARELMLSDVGRYLRVNVSADNSLLVPDQSEVPFRIGATVRVSQSGTGRTSVVPKSNATINTPNGYVLRKRFSSAILTYIGQDIWDLSGDLDETIINAPVTRADSDQVTADSDQITVDNG